MQPQADVLLRSSLIYKADPQLHEAAAGPLPRRSRGPQHSNSPNVHLPSCIAPAISNTCPVPDPPLRQVMYWHVPQSLRSMPLNHDKHSQSARCDCSRADSKGWAAGGISPHLNNTGQLLCHILSAGRQSVSVVSMTFVYSHSRTGLPA